VTSDDHRAWSPSAAYAGAVVCNGLGRYEEARHLAGRITLNAPVLGCGLWALPELVEAAVRTSDTPAAGSALARLARTAQASGTDWGLGVAARCRALVSQGATAEEHYQESLDRLTGSRVVVALARSQLLYGEWLRRENRRIEARVQLRTAWELFDGLGAAVFAGRARRELAATGERTRGRSGAGDHLTPQELQIAQLAAAGCSNCEIAERLYLSPRTVEYHLHKAFLRLGIRSRNQLHGLLPPPTVP
jgi:DNA-binding CsgD family transcriptional regulator